MAWNSSIRNRVKPAVLKKAREAGFLIFGKYIEVCYLCGEEVDIKLQEGLPGSPEIDHIVSRKNGGGNNIENLELSHKACNLMKGTLPVDAAKRKLREARKTSRIW